MTDALTFVRIDGSQRKTFRGFLADAYPERHDLWKLLDEKFNKNLDDISKSGSQRQDYDLLVTTADSQGWIAALIEAVKGDRSLRPDIQEFAATFHHDIGPPLPTAERLECVLRLANPLLDAELWRQKLAKVLPLICRIAIKGGENGTGFLVGPKIVLTCHHVINSLLAEGGEPRKGIQDQVTFRFDFHRTAEGEVTPGVEWRLAKRKWLLDHSPVSKVDLALKAGLPAKTELDYALLRLEPPDGDPSRGWLPLEAVKVAANEPLFIVGHPDEGAGTQRLSLETNAVIGFNKNETQLRYRTNTKAGSSGSPCFTHNWKVVALHHSKDPASAATYNEGIPCSAILSLLEERGMLKWLGQTIVRRPLRPKKS
jgi:V8-like Glu-specific endopeptidase